MAQNSSIRRKITTRVVEALKPDQTIWDSEITGFAIRKQKRDAVYFVRKRIAGRRHFKTIGKHGSPWTSKMAREASLKWLAAIAEGMDPAAARFREKGIPTISELAEEFLSDHVAAKRKPSTLRDYRGVFTIHIIPAIGKIRVDRVIQSDVARIHHNLKDRPVQANRSLAVLSKMFNWAEQRGYRKTGSNPCKGIERYKENKRERFLSNEEIARLGKVLDNAEEQGESLYVVAAIRLLMFSGARLSEILTLRWNYIDFERRLILLPDSKTGQKAILLYSPGVRVLATLPRIESNPFVIVGDKENRHLVNLQKPWSRIRRRAGIKDVRIHDLRHTFVSIAARCGASLPIMGRMVGHTQAQTTLRYAHLVPDAVREFGETTSREIESLMLPEANRASGENAQIPNRS